MIDNAKEELKLLENKLDNDLKVLDQKLSEKNNEVYLKKETRSNQRIEKLEAKLQVKNDKMTTFNKDVLINIKRDLQNLEQKLNTETSYDKRKELEELIEQYNSTINFYNEDNTNILNVANLYMQFGGLKVIKNLSFEIKRGEIFGLIGPNGAGKTTVFNCVTQFYKPFAGDIRFKNKYGEVVNLLELNVHDVIDYGLARTFQNIELITELTILENMLVGAHKSYRTSLFGQMIHSKSLNEEEKVIRAKALKILDEFGLLDYKDNYPVGLPYGVLKRIEFARTLMLNPELIILDEPAAGLNESETNELTEFIKI